MGWDAICPANQCLSIKIPGIRILGFLTGNLMSTTSFKWGFARFDRSVQVDSTE